MKKIIFVIGLALILGCSSKNDIYSNTYSGTLELTEHVLGAKAAGRVASMMVKEGDLVKVSQLMATFDRYEQTKKDYDRIVDLFKMGGTNEQAVEYARLALEDQQILASMDAVVLVKTAETGEILPAGAAVVVVGDPKDQWIKIYLPESQIGQIRLGQAVNIKVDGLNKIYQGHISFIALNGEFTPRNLQSKEERMTQAFAVKITLDNPDEFVHPGVSAEVNFKK